MNIENLIDLWADSLKRNEYGMLMETFTPHNREMLQSAFTTNGTTKMEPTDRFLAVAYEMMNEQFFKNELPRQLKFVIKSAPRGGYVGQASYIINNRDRTVTPTSITLNSSRILSLHEWLEVVLHEMIHVKDYVSNPDHFLGYMRKLYDAHGNWFLGFGKQFEKDGFHVEKYCSADIGINTDDSKVKNIMNRSIFIWLDGMKTLSGEPSIIKITGTQKDKYKNIFRRAVKNGRFEGLKNMVFLTTQNPKGTELPFTKMRDEHSGFTGYRFNDRFKGIYGPFEEVERYDVTSGNLYEDKDEEDFDTYNHIDDEYAKKMYDNIKGVVNVEKTGDGEYEVSIA